MAVVKADESQQIVFGWAGKYLDADGSPLVDLQGDEIDPSEVEKASYNYMLKSRESGVMHDGECCGHIVASLVTTPEVVKAFFGPNIRLPVGWLIGVKYYDQKIFKRVVSGELRMFSIQGRADSVEV